MEIDVDLHATDVDQLCAAPLSIFDQAVGSRQIFGEIRFAFDVDGIGAQRALASRFSQSDRIENTFRYPVAICRSMYLPFAIDRVDWLRSLTGKRGQDEHWQREQVLQSVERFHG